MLKNQVINIFVATAFRQTAVKRVFLSKKINKAKSCL